MKKYIVPFLVCLMFISGCSCSKPKDVFDSEPDTEKVSIELNQDNKISDAFKDEEESSDEITAVSVISSDYPIGSDYEIELKHDAVIIPETDECPSRLENNQENEFQDENEGELFIIP